MWHASLLLALLAADPALWHLSGWQARAVVEITAVAPESDVDVAAVRILGQGRVKSDGSDFRVVNSQGQAVQFQLVFHDAARASLISFRAAGAKAGDRFYIYFSNTGATRAAEEVQANPAPGSGPPQGAWIPRHGLVFATQTRPEGPNPESIEELARLLEKSQARHGARYQRRIADGHNPFGSSDNYLSVYRGWLRIPAGGAYRFCTASNEASFSFLDGKPLVHWPGRHTAERGLRGEKNAQVQLDAGLHYVEYYHEEVALEQVAFLGWIPAGAGTEQFSPIPESAFTAPHTATVVRYETPTAPLLAFEPMIVDSIWPTERHHGQYTRVRFKASQASAVSNEAQLRWEFGDGQTATGGEVEHVFLRLGAFPVRLSVEGAAAVEWPLDVYEIQHVTEEIGQGKPDEYRKLISHYEPQTLDAESLAELCQFLTESGQAAETLKSGKLFTERFAAAHARLLPEVQRVVAFATLELNEGNITEALTAFNQSLTGESAASEKLDALARMIRLVGVKRRLPEQIAPLLAQAEEIVTSAPLDEDSRDAWRRAIIAAGDAQLFAGTLDEARRLYQRAETLSGQRIPSQVRAARIGAWPNAIRELLDSASYETAIREIDSWELTFPSEKLKGQTLFWRGKALRLRGENHEAARHLARAASLGVGSSFETEARWLLAESLRELGRAAESRTELAKLVATGLNDEFTKKARQALQGENPKPR